MGGDKNSACRIHYSLVFFFTFSPFRKFIIKNLLSFQIKVHEKKNGQKDLHSIRIAFNWCGQRQTSPSFVSIYLLISNHSKLNLCAIKSVFIESGII